MEEIEVLSCIRGYHISKTCGQQQSEKRWLVKESPTARERY